MKRVGVILCLIIFSVSLLVGLPSLFGKMALPSSNATSAAQLSISVAPSLLLANQNFTAQMSVQLLNIYSLTPVEATSPVQVIVTSNNTNVAWVNSPLYIVPGWSFGNETLHAGGSTGVALIKASAEGYLPTTFIVYASVPPASTTGYKVGLTTYFAPAEILSDDKTYPNLVVGELQAIAPNGSALPEIASNVGSSDVTVYARSSDNSTMEIWTSSQTISLGNFGFANNVYASFNINSTYFPGSANITLQANGLNPVTSGLISYPSGKSPPPQITPYFNVQNTITPVRVLPGSSFSVLIDAQTFGAPITSAGANLTWSSKQANITGSQANLNATGFGSATFVASKQSGPELIQVAIKEGGITPYLDNITVNAYLNNMSVTLTNTHPAMITNYQIVLTIHATFNGTGVANASIIWAPTGGSLVDAPALTNKTGYATVTYQSGGEAGNFSVGATVVKSGFVNATQRIYISVVKPTQIVKPPSTPTNPLDVKVGNLIPLWILIPIVAGGAFGGFFVYKRFRGDSDYYGDGDDEE